jgi:hypothetical protein
MNYKKIEEQIRRFHDCQMKKKDQSNVWMILSSLLLMTLK